MGLKRPIMVSPRAGAEGVALYDLIYGQRRLEVVRMQGVELSEELDGLWWTISKAKTKNKRVERATANR
ncbi:hypothetical protein [Paraburkholderia sp.]|uniref:hypothetical protein n=1 Tax=Paraburkholderia sp. TaxID=1926495 RepID=UPI003C7E7532